MNSVSSTRSSYDLGKVADTFDKGFPPPQDDRIGKGSLLNCLWIWTSLNLFLLESRGFFRLNQCSHVFNQLIHINFMHMTDDYVFFLNLMNIFTFTTGNKFKHVYSLRVKMRYNFSPPIKQLLSLFADLQIITECFSTSFYLLTLCKISSWTAHNCWTHDLLFFLFPRRKRFD